MMRFPPFLQLRRSWSSDASLPLGHSLACLDQTRSVIRLQGEQAILFLQGMVTNDMRPLEEPGSPPVYAAMLNPKGKLLHDLIVYREEQGQAGPSSGMALLVDVDSSGKQAALDMLARYKLRRPVVITDVSEEQRVWVASRQEGEEEEQERPPQAFASPTGGPPGTSAGDALLPTGGHPGTSAGSWHGDPRLPALGFRGIFSGGRAPPANAAAAAAYRRWRYVNGVAEGEQEMASGQSVPLEYSLDALHGISYTKGCYVGQERVSYSHYRGVTRRRCMPFRLRDHASSDPSQQLTADSEVCVHGSGEVAGTVRAHEAGVGLALLKLSVVAQAEAGTMQLTVVGAGKESVGIMPFRPVWWLDEWGREEQQQQL